MKRKNVKVSHLFYSSIARLIAVLLAKPDLVRRTKAILIFLRLHNLAKLLLQTIWQISENDILTSDPRSELLVLADYGWEDDAARPAGRAQSWIVSQRLPLPRLMLDVTGTVNWPHISGIPRTARRLALEWLSSLPVGYDVELVSLTRGRNGVWCYRTQREFAAQLCDKPFMDDDFYVEVMKGDILLTLDISDRLLVDAVSQGLFMQLREKGVTIASIVYDLLPIQIPYSFPDEQDVKHEQWLAAVVSGDVAICISRSVAEDMAEWARTVPVANSYAIGWSHLGFDFRQSNVEETFELPRTISRALGSRPTFIMVGTIEPRKGYSEVLDAFEILWADGIEANLIVVGRQGQHYGRAQASINQISARMRKHRQAGTRLFWVENCTDELLSHLYKTSSCLIAASLNEGFGLPLVEARAAGLPIIARDIRIFREVAGPASFFKEGTACGIASVLRDFLAHPEGSTSTWLPPRSWSQAAADIFQLIQTPNKFIGEPTGRAGMLLDQNAERIVE